MPNESHTLSLSQIKQLRALLAPYGVEVKAKPKARAYRFKTPGFRWYSGISAAECKGPRLIYKGKLCPGSHHLWPADIAAYYASLEA
jgi:hypothetical protein